MLWGMKTIILSLAMSLEHCARQVLIEKFYYREVVYEYKYYAHLVYLHFLSLCIMAWQLLCSFPPHLAAKAILSGKPVICVLLYIYL